MGRRQEEREESLAIKWNFRFWSSETFFMVLEPNHRPPSSEQNNNTQGLLLWILIYLFLTHVLCCFDFLNNGKVQGERDNKLHSLLFAITGNLEGLFSKLELLSAFGRSHYQTFILLPSRRDGLQCMITSTYETHTPEISDNRPAKMENQGAGTRFSPPIKTTHTHRGRYQHKYMSLVFSFYFLFIVMRHQPYSDGASQNLNHKSNRNNIFQHTWNGIFK